MHFGISGSQLPLSLPSICVKHAVGFGHVSCGAVMHEAGDKIFEFHHETQKDICGPKKPEGILNEET